MSCNISQPKEGGPNLPYLAGEVVLVHENVFKTPHLEAVDVTKLALPVEVLPTVLALVDELLRKLAEQLHALRQVIFIPIVVFSRSAIEIDKECTATSCSERQNRQLPLPKYCCRKTRRRSQCYTWFPPAASHYNIKTHNKVERNRCCISINAQEIDKNRSTCRLFVFPADRLGNYGSDTLRHFGEYAVCRPWVEKKVSGEQLEQDARQAPHVRACVVPHTSDDLPGGDGLVLVEIYINRQIPCITKHHSSVLDPIRNT